MRVMAVPIVFLCLVTGVNSDEPGEREMGQAFAAELRANVQGALDYVKETRGEDLLSQGADPRHHGGGPARIHLHLVEGSDPELLHLPTGFFVEELELLRSAQDGGRTLTGAGEVGGRGIVRHGNDEGSCVLRVVNRGGCTAERRCTRGERESEGMTGVLRCHGG